MSQDIDTSSLTSTPGSRLEDLKTPPPQFQFQHRLETTARDDDEQDVDHYYEDDGDEEEEEEEELKTNKKFKQAKHHHHHHHHHGDFILSGLELLKTNKILCDVTLVAQSKLLAFLFCF